MRRVVYLSVYNDAQSGVPQCVQRCYLRVEYSSPLLPQGVVLLTVVDLGMGYLPPLLT